MNFGIGELSNFWNFEIIEEKNIIYGFPKKLFLIEKI